MLYIYFPFWLCLELCGVKSLWNKPKTMQSESELWRHPNERPFWSILVLPIVSSSLKYQKKDWNEVITCNFEVFWLLRNELLLHCTDQKGQTLFFCVSLSFFPVPAFFPAPTFFPASSPLEVKPLARWDCLNCSSGAISWQNLRIAGKAAGRGTAGWELDLQPAPAMIHCLTVFCWDYFWLSLLQKMN